MALSRLLETAISRPILTTSLAITLAYASIKYYHQRSNDSSKPISVNYHFTRHCNYQCGFCFHTETSSRQLPSQDWQHGLHLLKQAGMLKLNFAGGEPFLYPKTLSAMCRYAKDVLNLESVSIVSNGSKITERWIRENAKYVDIIAVSCDSFNPETNIAIGRGTSGENVTFLRRVASWCAQYGIKFKMNTVVCSLNWDEDMANHIVALAPFRWKVFQCLLVTGENENEERKRDARKLLVSDEQWKVFCERHGHLECFVPESNEMMKSSYLILDEDMCFLDKGDGEETRSESILKVGVREAMKQVRFDREAFVKRGGVYEWGREEESGCGSESGLLMEELEF
ncbi:radical SAM enzyme [Microthyrium microscopicum]|uniref:Radical SAM enzyme n=1 Tax=Microthyrium microscopicum TaxID=703497 RepID=A0A6A6UFD9_9PEZI|nr:radical SAM enzyme [Microthyrium microscopicum]